MRPKVICH